MRCIGFETRTVLLPHFLILSLQREQRTKGGEPKIVHQNELVSVSLGLLPDLEEKLEWP